jgi:hypothetical protein
MFTAIKGVYENGEIHLTEEAPAITRSEVIITFLNNIEEHKPKENHKGVRLGSLQGKFNIPDDFNEPLEDLKEYM